MNILTPEERNECADRLFSALLEKGVDGVLIVQQNAHIVYANKQAESLLGFSSQELLNMPYVSIFADTLRGNDIDRFHTFFNEEKEADRYESEILTKDGRLIPVEVSIFGTVFRNEDAQIVVMRDVASHQQMEVELQKNVERYKELATIVDRSFEAIMITDLQGTIQYVNASWERLNGWTSDEIIGKVTPRVIKSGVQPPSFYEEFWKMLLAGDAVERVVTNRRKDGTLYEAEIIAIPLKDDQGVIARFAGFQHDITVRNSAQAQLTLEKQFSEDIVEHANAIVIVLDPQGVVTRFNEKAEVVTGYTKDEILGKSLFETLFPRDKYPLLWSEFSYAEGEEDLMKSFENEITTKTGDVRQISWTVNEIAKDGKTVAIISFGSDITDRKKIEADLLEKNTDLERFKDLMVGRELRMIELKNELKSLKQPIITPDNEKKAVDQK